MSAELSEAQREILMAVAEAALPPGRIFPGAGRDVARRAESFVGSLSTPVAQGYGALLWTLQAWSLARTGTSFASLPLGRRLSLLEGWAAAEAGRIPARMLIAPLKLAHFDDASIYRSLGCRHVIDPPKREKQRWRDRVINASTFNSGELLECDVVVVGTGAGGAPVARALAERGHAVLMVEEGPYFDRTDFNGRAVDMMRKLYRKGGTTASFGNTVIPIPVGRGVGGTTLINCGTCFRVPEKTLAEWREKMNLTEFTPDLLAPHYESVERELGVAPSAPKHLGRTAELIAQGCDALGWSHHPLKRNAPDCDGQGLCAFGCPTDAKKSTNVSYVPKALERGAQLLTGLKIDRVLVENERAVGVVGRAGDRVLTIRARVVVLACGSLHTPTLLLKNGLANTSGEVGKNLSIHPATAAMALFDEPVNSSNSVPQGYAIDQFSSEGIMFEGASVPLDITAVSLPGFGPGFVDLMERFNETLNFGFMVKDTSRGRVSVGADGEPRISYWLNENDTARVQRGMALLCRVFFAAGAREVHAPVHGHERFRDLRDVERLEKSKLAARHVDLSAYHPLGTARMGKDPLK